MKKSLSLLTLFSIIGCSNLKEMSYNQRAEGHHRLYTHPEKPKHSHPKRFKRLIIFGSNDHLGNSDSKYYKVENRFKENRFIGIGGITAAKAYYDVAKKVFPNQTLRVDAGSFLEPKKDAKMSVFYYNYLKPDAVGLGMGEMSYESFPILFNYLKPAKFPLVNSNIYDLQSHRLYKTPVFKRAKLKTVNGLKIGIISAFSDEHIEKIPKQKLKGLYVRSIAQTVIQESNRLRKRGAKVIVLLTNSSVDCTSMQAQTKEISTFKVNFNPRDPKACDLYKNTLASALKLLPKGSLDIVFTSGKNTKTANFISGFPVLQNYTGGDYLSWAELFYDTKLKSIDQKYTIIRQPVQLCHHFLKNSEDCYVQENIHYQEVIPAKFLGEEIKVSPLPKPKRR